MERASPTVAQHAAEVAGALAPHTAKLSADIYQLIVREIPELRTDRRVLALLEASVAENVATVLHILQHGIDLDHVHAPAAAEEYGRRLAQRRIPMAALLRAYRIGSTRFQHWCLHELAQHTDDASIVSAAGLRIAETTAAYIDQVSEELVAAYQAEKENWLRNLSAARAASVRALLQGDQVDVDAAGMGTVADLKQLFQFLGLADEPVLVVDDHRVDGAFLEVLQHPQKAWTRLGGVLQRRQVVVAVLVDDRLAEPARERLTVLALAGKAEPAGLGVLGHAQVQAWITQAPHLVGLLPRGSYPSLRWWSGPPSVVTIGSLGAPASPAAPGFYGRG